MCTPRLPILTDINEVKPRTTNAVSLQLTSYGRSQYFRLSITYGSLYDSTICHVTNVDLSCLW